MGDTKRRMQNTIRRLQIGMLFAAVLFLCSIVTRPANGTFEGCHTDTECETAEGRLDAVITRLDKLERIVQSCGGLKGSQFNECAEYE